MSAANLWERLRADGVVEGELPPRGEAQSPWYVRVMLGIAGWIGALFLLGFVGAALAFVMDDPTSAIVAGAGCCGVAYVLFRKFEHHDFAAQFALVVSLAGQAMLVIGLSQVLRPNNPALYFTLALVGAALAWAIPNFLHRVLASAGAAVALALGLNQLSLPFLSIPLLCATLALIWLDSGRWARGGQLWRGIGYGVVLALLLVETVRLFGAERLFSGRKEALTWIDVHGPLIGRGATAAILAAVAVHLCRRELLAPSSRAFLAATGGAVLVGLVSLRAPGLAAALLVLLLGFAAGNRLLQAFGVLSLLGFVTYFYYSLHATLLEKSGLLAVTGLLLLGACYLLRYKPEAAREPADA